MAMHGNCSCPVMSATVQQTWQVLLPMHGNQLLSVQELGFYMHGSCSPTCMANTAANTWQPVCSSIKTLYSRLELTRQMQSTISATHMLLAVGKSRRQYMSHCTRPLVSVFCLIFLHHHCYKSSFPHILFPQKQMQCCFCGSNFLTLLCRMCPSCVVSHQIDVLCLQSVKLAMRRLPR